MLFAAPIAILGCHVLASFATNWMRELIKPAIEFARRIPVGGHRFFRPDGDGNFFSEISLDTDGALMHLWAGVAHGPWPANSDHFFTITEDGPYRGSRAPIPKPAWLGATRWQTKPWLLPCRPPTPGIFAAILLGIGRGCSGKTMIALWQPGNAAMTSLNPFESVRTLGRPPLAKWQKLYFGRLSITVCSFLIGSLLLSLIFTLIDR